MFEKYAEVYDLINKDKPYRNEIEFVYKWAGEPDSILDLGAGTASYWKYLPTMPIGIEKSKEMIEQSEFKRWIIHDDILNMKTPFLDLSFDCVTALFDVMNYLPRHDWWSRLPLMEGGSFIFDIWDKEKAEKEKFKETIKKFKGGFRGIVPFKRGDKVDLVIWVKYKKKSIVEKHTMYLYSEEDLKKFCGRNYKIVDKKETDTWQVWYKLEKR